MHFWRAVLLIHIFFIFFPSAEAISATQQNQEELLLLTELQLAQKPDIYFIMNLKENRILLKARGIVVRDLKIKDRKFWGPADTVKLYVMTGKTSSAEPHRETVIPENIKQNETAPQPAAVVPTADLKALELSDMPASFTLKLGDALTVSVKPDIKGKFPGLYSMLDSLNWYISQPMITVWNSVKKRPYRVLNLVLDENDARALYWSLHEGAEVLIYNP